MEWIIGVVIVYFIFYFMSRGESKAAVRERAKAVAVKDFIQNEKVYTQEDAVKTIYQFMVALGDTEEMAYTRGAQDVANSFPVLLKELKKEYRRELKDLNAEIADTNRFYEEQIEGIKSNPDYDEDSRKEELSDTKSEWKDDLKPNKKMAGWYEKQISAIDENPKQVLKKALQEIKILHRENFYIPELNKLLDDFVKELPERYTS